MRLLRRAIISSFRAIRSPGGVIYDESKGKYSVSENCYVALVQKKLKGIVRNASRFGNTITRGIGKLGRDIAKDPPDVVLIEYGGNDCDFAWAEVAAHPDVDHEPQTDLALFEDTLTDTIASLKEKSIVPVLMTLPPLNADRYIKWVSKQDPLVEGDIMKWLGSVTKIYWWQERYSSSVARVARKDADEAHRHQGSLPPARRFQRPDLPGRDTSQRAGARAYRGHHSRLHLEPLLVSALRRARARSSLGLAGRPIRAEGLPAAWVTRSGLPLRPDGLRRSRSTHSGVLEAAPHAG